jgi:uncharacterized protein HemX
MKQHNRQSGSIVVYAVALVALVAVLGVGLFVLHKHNKPNTAGTDMAANSSSSSSTNSALNKSLSSGTSNSDLNGDLQNLNGSLNQSNQQLQSAGSSLSDQQLPVNDN